MKSKLSITFCLLFLIFSVYSDTYKLGDKIPVIVDKVWPKSNPSESYNYFSLSFCPPKEQLSEGFAYAITGSRKYVSKYKIEYGVDQKHSVLCKKITLTKEKLQELRVSVDKEYFFLMHLDDLPIREHIGSRKLISNGKYQYFLYTHLDFQLTYNKDRIISVAFSKKFNPVDITKNEEKEIEFSYSVKWIPTKKEYHNRLEKYVDSNMYPEEVDIQWFSIINSLVLVLLLTFFLSFILLRILKRDFQKYTEPDPEDESGWKLIHADIFRFPSHVNLLSAILGNGSQLLSLSILVLSFALLGAYYPDYSYRTMYTSMIFIYVFTTGINGFISGMFYKQLGGESWVKNVLLTTFLFTGPAFIIWSILNTIAIHFGSTAAFPFRSIAIILALYILISFPLTLIGAITAKNFVGPFTSPCRTKVVPRALPPIPWYKGSFAQFFIAGFLPFSAIYVELYYVMISLWGTIMYTPFPILVLVFIVLILVTSCITIAMTYLQISQEDHYWWWRAVLSGGSTSIFILAYSVFFYNVESSMQGFLQMTFYAGYTFLTCFAFFLMLSTVGFISSLLFLKQIYSVIRID